MEIQYVDQGSHGSAGYRAGACNIGPTDVARRRRAGIAGVAFAIALGMVLVAIDAPPLARGLVLFPLWGGLISLEQARRKFCVAFAYGGIRSTAPNEAREVVVDEEDRSADRAAARRMVAGCGLIALAVSIIFVMLPV